MNAIALLPSFRSARRLARQRPGWKSRPLNDRGVTTVLVAISLLAVLTLVALLFNVGGALLARQRLQTMAEFGAAGGGRILAEQITLIAEDNVKKNIFPLPQTAEEKAAPEKFITPAQREALQSDLLIISAVVAGAREYVAKNIPTSFMPYNAYDDNLVAIAYPESPIDCAGGGRTVKIAVTARYNFPIIFNKLAELMGAQSELPLSAIGRYAVPICE